MQGCRKRVGRVGTRPPRFWPDRRRRITTCLPRFSDFATPLMLINWLLWMRFFFTCGLKRVVNWRLSLHQASTVARTTDSRWHFKNPKCCKNFVTAEPAVQTKDLLKHSTTLLLSEGILKALKREKTSSQKYTVIALWMWLKKYLQKLNTLILIESTCRR